MAIKTYVSVNGGRKQLKKWYASINGARKELQKVYASVGGQRKLIYTKSSPTPVSQYGDLWYWDAYAETESEIVKKVQLQSVAEFNSLAPTIGQNPLEDIADGWTATVGAERVTVSNSFRTGEERYIALGIDVGPQITTIPDGFFAATVPFFGYGVNLSGAINLTTIGNYAFAYMQGDSDADPYTYPLRIPNTVTSIGTYFMYRCYHVNSVVTLPNGLQSIPRFFMVECRAFNQPLAIPDTVTSIGEGFMLNCHKFNQPLTIPSGVTTIPDYFLCNNGSNLSKGMDYNSTLTLPNTVISIGNGFLKNQLSFNQPLALPSSLSTIGYDFMNRCEAFNQNIALPSSLSYVGHTFMYDCDSMVSAVNVGNLAPSVMRLGNPHNFAHNKNTVPSYLNGIKFAGTNRAAWITAFPDCDTPAGGGANNYYRKIVDAGY